MLLPPMLSVESFCSHHEGLRLLMKLTVPVCPFFCILAYDFVIRLVKWSLHCCSVYHVLFHAYLALPCHLAL